jgi:transcriptional regulator with XRE-family HTH domain
MCTITKTPVKMPTDLGGRLRFLRQCAGLSAEQVGVELGITARVIGDWERNYREPRLFYLGRLADLYQVPIANLIRDAEITTR